MTIRGILFLALIGFMATAQPLPFDGQDNGVLSNEPIIKVDQAQYPPPPDCGIYPDTCKSDKKG